MDIGNKLQRARTKANFTQEQVAEALGVSRQTISNWENEKTYPDIRSVVTLSDLYNVSLDDLLKNKEESSMTDYVNYLEESTNTVKGKNRLSEIILAVAYLVIWAFALISFWFFTDEADALGYSLVFLWLILPVTTFVVSLLIGKNNHFGRVKWIMPLVLGVMHMLAEYSTFSLKNMLSFNKINMPSFELILVGGVISLIALGIGNIVYCMKSKKKNH